MINSYSYIIVAALFLELLLDVIADVLNIRAMKRRIPADLVGVYKPEEYRKSQDYTRSRTSFGLVVSLFGLLTIVLFWFMGGFNYLDQMVRSWGFGVILNGLCYTGILVIAYMLLTLPFNIYSTFVIEERFGFNRTTPYVFVTDLIKGITITILLGGSLLAGILCLFEYAGNYAWLYCWIVVIIYMMVVQLIAPIWIMPLFNKFTPMKSGGLKDAIQNYANSVGYRVGNISVMDGSKRSNKTNAFFTGFGRTKRIALFDTLVSKHTVQELVAVLAHEIGHYKKKHVLQGIVIGIAHAGLSLFLLSVILGDSALYKAFYMEQTSVYAGILFFGLLYTPIEMILSIVLQVFSRRREFEADRFACETTGDTISLIDALKKLATENLSNLTPHPFYVFLKYSHPPIHQRVKAILKYEI
ncbi:M48 family metallopeptidase [Chloroflexota bacterium]